VSASSVFSLCVFFFAAFSLFVECENFAPTVFLILDLLFSLCFVIRGLFLVPSTSIEHRDHDDLGFWFLPWRASAPRNIRHSSFCIVISALQCLPTVSFALSSVLLDLRSFVGTRFRPIQSIYLRIRIRAWILVAVPVNGVSCTTADRPSHPSLRACPS
jgi:hypothetical protein